MTAMPPALYYSAESYSTKGTKLMGRQAAGKGFLRALLAEYAELPIEAVMHAGGEEALINDEFRKLGHLANVEAIQLSDLERLRAQILYVPSPGLEKLAWHRAQVSERQFSLCGITHTTASHSVMETISNLPLTAIRSWDALICTSGAVKSTIETILEQQFEYLRWKVGATRFELPVLPVIPLGVHSQDFQFSEVQRLKERDSLGISPDDLVILFVGRLSFHAKAHPHPMLLSMQACVDRGLKSKIHLIQCGWYANDAIHAAFESAQKAYSPDVQHHFLDGRIPEARATAWASADIFVSLSDNVQETFGLTPIEAMACGLPCVVSDWDGYKDTVEHGVSGYRVRTVSPSPGAGSELGKRYDLGLDSYDMYCGQLCQSIGVSVTETTNALYALLSDKELRLRMGHEARSRAETVFDWSVVMRQYSDLWRQLNAIREYQRSPFGDNPLRVSPARMDPFTVFCDYASDVVSPHMTVALVKALDSETYRGLVTNGTFRYARSVLPEFEVIDRIQQQLSDAHQKTFADLCELLPNDPPRMVERACMWLYKVGVIEL